MRAEVWGQPACQPVRPPSWCGGCSAAVTCFVFWVVWNCGGQGVCVGGRGSARRGISPGGQQPARAPDHEKPSQLLLIGRTPPCSRRSSTGVCVCATPGEEQLGFQRMMIWCASSPSDGESRTCAPFGRCAETACCRCLSGTRWSERGPRARCEVATAGSGGEEVEGRAKGSGKGRGTSCRRARCRMRMARLAAGREHLMPWQGLRP